MNSNNLDTMQNKMAQERREHEIYQRELSIFFWGAITMGVIMMGAILIINALKS